MQKIYVVAAVSEDNYIQVDGCYLDYSKADQRATELMSESDDEWEVIPSNIEIKDVITNKILQL